VFGALKMATTRHTLEHDVWAPDGRCDVLIMEDDGTVTRCGFKPERSSFDASQASLAEMRPPENHTTRNVIVGVLVALVGLAIALDWLAFSIYVGRFGATPELTPAFIMRVVVSIGFGAAVMWLWRRR